MGGARRSAFFVCVSVCVCAVVAVAIFYECIYPPHRFLGCVSTKRRGPKTTAALGFWEVFFFFFNSRGRGGQRRRW